MSSSSVQVRIRRIWGTDAAQAADLCTQLGYPVTARELARRLNETMRDKDTACFIAEDVGRKVIGWIHVSVTPLLEVERRAEVNGLVVDEQARSRGAGALLLAAGEKWARGKRCKEMSVRSNVLRERAHGFYLRNGYEHYKTQKAFRKTL